MDQNEIINKRVRRIARDHGCSVAEVNTALDHHPTELDRDKFLKRTLAMELVELDELQRGFREKALVDHDTAAGGLLIKVAERRATLLGLKSAYRTCGPGGPARAAERPFPNIPLGSVNGGPDWQRIRTTENPGRKNGRASRRSDIISAVETGISSKKMNSLDG